jgi:hypothetical protein
VRRTTTREAEWREPRLSRVLPRGCVGALRTRDEKNTDLPATFLIKRPRSCFISFFHESSLLHIRQSLHIERQPISVSILSFFLSLFSSFLSSFLYLFLSFLLLSLFSCFISLLFLPSFACFIYYFFLSVSLTGNITKLYMPLQ